MFQLFENSKDISFLQNLYFTNFNDEYILYAVGNQLQLKEKNNYQYLGTYLYTIRANTNSSALKLLAPDVTNNYMASSWTFNTYTNSELYIGFYNGDLYEKKIASGNISKIATLNTQINNIVILKDQEKLLITTNTTNYTVSILENSINNYKNNYKVFYYYDLISYSYYIYELDNLNSKIYIWNNNILVTTINLPKDKIYTNISIKNNGDIYVLSTTSTLIFKRIGTVIYQYNDRFSEWVIALKNIDNSNNFYVITNDNKIFYYE